MFQNVKILQLIHNHNYLVWIFDNITYIHGHQLMMSTILKLKQTNTQSGGKKKNNRETKWEAIGIGFLLCNVRNVGGSIKQ